MDAVEEIKSRLPIEEVVGRYVELKRSGASFKGLCPFHQEKTPSFYVTPHRGSYHCFGCDKGGDIFSFIMEAERLAFPEALQRLAEQAGIQLPERGSNRQSLTGRLYEANEAAARFFHDALRSDQGTVARRYLTERDFGADSIVLFQLGVSPAGRDALVTALRTAGIEDRILLAAGLAMQEEGGGLRDRFRGRLMFPIRDASGRVSGFGGRTLTDAGPKYLNSPQTEVFDKSAVLYGIHLAAESMRKAGSGVLVEGYLDAVRAHGSGFPATAASLGTAVTVAQLSALSRTAKTVIIALDPDPAGQSAAARAALTALAEVSRTRSREAGAAGAVDLRVATLPENLGDPDECIRDHPDQWEAVIASSVPAFEFFYSQTMVLLDRASSAWRQEAIDRLLPVIQQFSQTAGWQAEWIERLARDTGVEARGLQRSVSSAPPSARRRGSSPGIGQGQEVTGTTTSRALTTDPLTGVEQALLALLLQIIVVPAPVMAELSGVVLGRPEDRALLDAILAWAPRENYDYEMLRETLSEELREYADQLRARQEPLPDTGKISVAVALHLARIRQFRIHAQLTRGSQTLVDVDVDGQVEAVKALRRLTIEQQEVEQILDRLSRQVLQASSGGPIQGTMDQDSGSV